MCRVFVRHPCCSAADVFITRPRLESSSITHQGGNIQQAAVSESMLAGKAMGCTASGTAAMCVYCQDVVGSDDSACCRGLAAHHHQAR